jgi:hypothetical protein
VTYDPRSIQRIAVLADVHPDTVRRLFRGQPVRPSSRRRILGALEQLAATSGGLELDPTDPTTTREPTA